MSSTPRHVIGLTGLPSSGKGEVANAFTECAAERHWQAAHLSFSDCIKEVVRTLGYSDAQFERAMLSRTATQMREVHGPGVFALRIAAKIAAWPAPCPEVFVVEALRHPGEATALRGAYGKRFVLVGVESEPGIIAQRLLHRARADESHTAMQSKQHVILLLNQELRGSASPQSPNVGATLALADKIIQNNGTLEALRKKVASLFAELSAD